ncbi:hypothetical protein HWV62_32252 [Athelia sp. TMB]|nr:hypothetical protein HWV62_32252 [Athelia sp. TMB]
MPIRDKGQHAFYILLLDVDVVQWVIRTGSQDPEEMIFRVVLFDLFTRQDTWTHIIEKIGHPVWATYDRDVYLQVLKEAKAAGKIYTGSFQKPSGKYGFKGVLPNHLAMLEQLMEDDLPGRVVNAKRISEVYDWLRSFSGLGPFNTWQMLQNIVYTGLLAHCEDLDSFVVLGCGAVKGLQRCFTTRLNTSMQKPVVRWMQKTQRLHFERLGYTPATLGPKKHELQLADIEHGLCELDKGRPEPFVLPINFESTLEAVKEVWEVSHIANQRRNPESGVMEYEVYWRGYDEPSWEPASVIEEDAMESVPNVRNAVTLAHQMHWHAVTSDPTHVVALF